MKIILSTIFLFLFISCNGQVEKNELLTRSLTDTTLKIRGNLIELGTSDYRLDYYDVYEKDSHYKFLESRAYQGGGASWLGIIYGAIKMSYPDLLNDIRFDDESDGLAIWSEDKSKLEKIGRLIAMLKSDDDLLLQAIDAANTLGQME
ncbi:immunity 51 family protein [Chitinophagales bacterium]|nr:immunity 51 family protein [Chitinophagales bacterium]